MRIFGFEYDLLTVLFRPRAEKQVIHFSFCSGSETAGAARVERGSAAPVEAELVLSAKCNILVLIPVKGRIQVIFFIIRPHIVYYIKIGVNRLHWQKPA